MTIGSNPLFSIVITGVNPSTKDAAAGQLAQACAVEPPVAATILRKAPIALFRDVSREDVDFAGPYLARLSASGIEFQTVQGSPDGIPKVNWPGPPDVRRLLNGYGSTASDTSRWRVPTGAGRPAEPMAVALPVDPSTPYVPATAIPRPASQAGGMASAIPVRAGHNATPSPQAGGMASAIPVQAGHYATPSPSTHAAHEGSGRLTAQPTAPPVYVQQSAQASPMLTAAAPAASLTARAAPPVVWATPLPGAVPHPSRATPLPGAASPFAGSVPTTPAPAPMQAGAPPFGANIPLTPAPAPVPGAAALAAAPAMTPGRVPSSARLAAPVSSAATRAPSSARVAAPGPVASHARSPSSTRLAVPIRPASGVISPGMPGGPTAAPAPGAAVIDVQCPCCRAGLKVRQTPAGPHVQLTTKPTVNPVEVEPASAGPIAELTNKNGPAAPAAPRPTVTEAPAAHAAEVHAQASALYPGTQVAPGAPAAGQAGLQSHGPIGRRREEANYGASVPIQDAAAPPQTTPVTAADASAYRRQETQIVVSKPDRVGHVTVGDSIAQPDDDEAERHTNDRAPPGGQYPRPATQSGQLQARHTTPARLQARHATPAPVLGSQAGEGNDLAGAATAGLAPEPIHDPKASKGGWHFSERSGEGLPIESADLHLYRSAQQQQPYRPQVIGPKPDDAEGTAEVFADAGPTWVPDAIASEPKPEPDPAPQPEPGSAAQPEYALGEELAREPDPELGPVNRPGPGAGQIAPAGSGQNSVVGEPILKPWTGPARAYKDPKADQRRHESR